MTPAPTGAQPHDPAGRPARGGLPAFVRPAPSDGRLHTAIAVSVPLLVVALAALLRFWDLGHPERIYFDETYYAQDARDLIQYGVERGRAVHPPVGKWLIGAGIAVFGYDPFGWRVAAAAAGTLTVALTYLVGRRLLGSVWLGALAALLVAVDGLALTMSRIAMLDAFLALFGIAACWALLIDHDQRRGGPRRLPGARWWAGIFLGLAIATKWSGLLALAAALLLVGTAELVSRARAGSSTPRAAMGAACSLVVPLLVLPVVVYVASYAGWFANWPDSHAGQRACAEPSCAASTLERTSSWVETQVEIVRFHRDLEASHPYRSDPLSWPLLKRPVLIYLEQCTPQMRLFGEQCVVEPGNREKILILGNPGVWWPALAAYPVLAWLALARRDARAVTLLTVLLSSWLPWFLSGKPGYLFYLTPAVPFIGLALALAAGAVAGQRRLGWVPAAVALTALGGLAWFLPLWWGLELSTTAEQARIWFNRWR